ncbi:hypothetical protein MUK42_29950 [Musa troglodytarum]|uniref:Uncharacterized protein n=1 Tax=Musa troglodytarum TaxID=320322 RepID=A0A9E7GF42_9LILI|nr:hypothetical protein MUK42_29950 [Musa troglodytarum]
MNDYLVSSSPPTFPLSQHTAAAQGLFPGLALSPHPAPHSLPSAAAIRRPEMGSGWYRGEAR